MEKRYVKTDKNGTQYFEVRMPCVKCGGTGKVFWSYMNHVCFMCDGAGTYTDIIKEYTHEHRAKLDAQKAKRAAKVAAERDAKRAEWERERKEREAAEEARKAAEAARKVISQYVGEIGQRITLPVTLEKEIYYEVRGYMGFGTETMTMFVFRDDAGNKLIWRTGGALKRPDGELANEGDRLTIVGTIKEHSEYNDERQTELQRVRAK